MKICGKCKCELSLDQFNKKGNGHQPFCRDCDKAAARERYKNNKDWYLSRNREQRNQIRTFVQAAKAKPCIDCGIEYPYYVMQFDHKGNKNFGLAEAVNKKWSLATIQSEIEKCDVVCANCHAERTHKRMLAVAQ